jgi:hypothetical protein
MKLQNLIHIVIGIVCVGLLAGAQAVVPAPDGGYPNFTTAEGTKALFSLTTGAANTAVGWYSLFSDTQGSFNTATGAGTLLFNTADENTAFGATALLFNTTGSDNTALGAAALLNNTEGNDNTAVGDGALRNNTTGPFNTANGFAALGSNTTGYYNTAIGYDAGLLITGSGNVCIGAAVGGAAAVNDTTWIRNIYDSVASGRAVYVNSDHKLGTLSSSRRYKEEIKPMDKASEAVLALKPVTFRYKKEIEPNGGIMFGLIAEEVERVAPDLVTHNAKGEAETVRYEAVNAMLLNEFLKEHRTVQELKSTLAQQQKDYQRTATRQQKQIEALTAGLQKVSDQLELSKPAPRTVGNNQ